MMIAGGNTLTSEFIAESKIIASQFLYDVLKKDSLLLNSDSTYQNFMEVKEVESVGYLYAAKNELKKIGKLDNTLITSIDDANGIINSLADSIYSLDSLTALNPNIENSYQREIYVGQIGDQQAIIEDALLQQKLLDATILSQVETTNNLVSITELPDENEKFINSVAVLLLKEGVNGIASYYTQILSVANQCPYEGGISVYRARVFVSLLNDTIGYDDETVCELQGIYRQSIQQSSIEIREWNHYPSKPNF